MILHFTTQCSCPSLVVRGVFTRFLSWISQDLISGLPMVMACNFLNNTHAIDKQHSKYIAASFVFVHCSICFVTPTCYFLPRAPFKARHDFQFIFEFFCVP